MPSAYESSAVTRRHQPSAVPKFTVDQVCRTMRSPPLHSQAIGEVHRYKNRNLDLDPNNKRTRVPNSQDLNTQPSQNSNKTFRVPTHARHSTHKTTNPIAHSHKENLYTIARSRTTYKTCGLLKCCQYKKPNIIENYLNSGTTYRK